MSQTKENEELEELTSHLIQEEETPPHSGFKEKVKMVVILFLSLACLTGGILIHNLRNFSFDKNSSLSEIETHRKAILSQKRAIAPETAATVMTPISAPVPSNLAQNDAFTPDNTAILDSGHTSADLALVDVPQNTSEVSELMRQNNNDPTAQELFEITTTSTDQKLTGFNLKDALLLKEHFLTESSCYDDYQKLLYASQKSAQALDVLNDLSPYCLSHQEPVENVRIAFLNDKKKALIASYKERNPLWLAYLKAIPASIIDFRKINPETEKPKDILFKAQNELYRQNVAKAVAYVTTLPLSMQREMKNFYREAAIYNRAMLSIDQLILSFEAKGE